MNTNILAITHRNFSHLYHEALEMLKLPLNLEILEVDFGELHKIDYDIFANFDLVITSGAHLDMIDEDYFELSYLTSIYPLHVTESDMVKGLVKAKQYSNNIMLLYSGNEDYNFKEYEQALGINIERVIFDDLEEAEKIMEKHYKNGYDAVLGTSSICEIADSLNITNVLLYSRDSLKTEIIKAYQFATTKNKMLRYAKIQDKILQHSENPIFLVDHNKKLIDTNRAGLNKLNKKAKHEVLGETVAICSEINFNDLTETFVTQSDDKEKVIIEPINQIGSKDHYLIIMKQTKFNKETDQYKRELNLKPKYKFSNIIHESKKMKKVILKATQYAETEAPLLIFGESGTGKELFAHSVHNQSDRKLEPFLPVNCAAIPKDILESELFGYEYGAFTGAKKDGKPGYFELAQNGTIFLDEIGEIPLELQTRLLRVLQEKEVIRLGGKKIIPLNVRIIAATNKSLDKLILEGKFREDLYYRINVLRINVPPVREIKGDIPLIIEHLLIKYGLEAQQANYLVNIAKDSLTSYDWPGNVREMENFSQRFSALKSITDTTLDLARTFTEIFAEFIESKVVLHEPITEDKSNMSYPELEKLKIINILLETKGNKNQAAEKLGISRTTLWRKIKQFDINHASISV